MTPVDFPECNLVLTTKQDPSVFPLPVLKSNGWLVSCWKLTPEERRMIAITGILWVAVKGDSHPPISPRVSEPFTSTAEPISLEAQ